MKGIIERGACYENYCPYCNRCPVDDMTDEHVIPRSIGGDSRTVIRVCSTCNSKAGHIVDPAVNRHSGLRAMGVLSGDLMKRHERHGSVGVLKDGRRLEGHFYWIKVGPNEVKPSFEPLKVQPDGSQWISEHACKDLSRLPGYINVYREELLDRASFTFSNSEGAGLAPSMVKILLGISYWGRGKAAVSLAGFDAMRNCLSGMIDARVRVSWLDSVETIRRKVPFEVPDRAHTIWSECSDGRVLEGGVILFGKTVAEITVCDFGHVLPGRCCTIDIPWMPQ